MSESALQHQAYNYIKKQILTGVLKVDELYSEAQIAKSLNISRTPVREALRALSQDGFISVVPSKGFIIRLLGEEDVKETIGVRCAIEGYCIHYLASDESDRAKETIGSMEEYLRQQQEAMETGDIERFMESDHKFHLSLIEYMDNKEFRRIFQRLMHMIHLTTAESLKRAGRITGTYSEHKRLLSALSHKDGQSAYEILINHLQMPIKMEVPKKPE